MHADCTFTVSEFTSIDWAPDVTTALATGHAHIAKTFTGDVVGRSIAQFSSSFDPEHGAGTYIALESFEGTLAGRTGTFNFVHSATTDGISPVRLDEFFLIVPNSGTGQLAGIRGTGALTIDAEGHHRIEFDYDFD